MEARQWIYQAFGFWCLRFSVKPQFAVEITNSVFDRTARYESYETCEIALLKQTAYWDSNPIKFSKDEGEKTALIDMSNGTFYFYSCNEIDG